MWHRRLADTSHRAIYEAVQNKLMEGGGVLEILSISKIERALSAPVTSVRVRRCIRFRFQLFEKGLSLGARKSAA